MRILLKSLQFTIMVIFAIVLSGCISSKTEITNIIISQIDFRFDKEKYSYDINVGYEMENIDIAVFKSGDSGFVLGSGRSLLKEGSNQIAVELLFENGDKTTYILNIHRETHIELARKNLQESGYNCNSSNICEGSTFVFYPNIGSFYSNNFSINLSNLTASFSRNNYPVTMQLLTGDMSFVDSYGSTSLYNVKTSIMTCRYGQGNTFAERYASEVCASYIRDAEPNYIAIVALFNRNGLDLSKIKP